MPGITERKAQSFIDKFFEIHRGVAKYHEFTRKFLYKYKFVRTITGRKRRIKFFDKGGYAERQAVNSRIQGSAADLIKIAMIRVDKALEGTSGQMLLQIHDEVVVKCDTADAENIAAIIKKEMINALELKVPLEVDVTISDRWGEGND